MRRRSAPLTGALLAGLVVTGAVLVGCSSHSGGSGTATPTTAPRTTTTMAMRPASGSGPIVFEDTFDGTGALDRSVWRAVVDVRHQSALTDRATNARRQNGNLVIEARRESASGMAYTSALIQTRTAFRYGRFEARMKLPTGAGTWPAFWLLGKPTWPIDGEIDVMEHYARHPAPGDAPTPSFGVVESNLHSPGTAAKPGDTARGRVTRTRIDPNTWHTYSVDWAPGTITFAVDGKVTATQTRPDGTGAGAGARTTTPADLATAWPFDDHPEVVAFDVFLGDFAGPVDGSAMPQQLLVDWVRVTRLPGVTTSIAPAP